jgi:hypothetical protein
VRRLLALAACATLAACARGASTTATPAVAPTSGRVGYVRMDVLVKSHPLYGQLAAYEQNIAALNLNGLVPQALAAGPKLERDRDRLQAQLTAAAQRTNALLQSEGKSYQARENAAIAAALRSAGAGAGPTVAQIRGQMEGTARTQVAGAGAQAQRDLDAYGKQLQAQDAAEIAAAQSALGARADRTYHAESDQLNAKEAALSLQLATADAPERLSLHTKLSSLALDDAARAAANADLAALDRKEADALAAEHNRDAQTLGALQAQLRASVQSDLNRQVAEIHARSEERFRERGDQLRTQFAPPSGPLIAAGPSAPPHTAAALPAALQQRIAQLHADYARAYRSDAQRTIDDFNKTRADLTRRFDALAATDAAAAQSAQSEIADLQKKHDALYAQMVAQIDREVKTIAQQRGVSIVVDSIAPAGGVDLTDDAMKDIESLHE